jgi:hypothetical protein
MKQDLMAGIAMQTAHVAPPKRATRILTLLISFIVGKPYTKLQASAVAAISDQRKR